MNKKSIITCSFILALFSFLFYACKGSPYSPEITKTAIIDITVDPDPLLFHWHPELNYGTFTCDVTLSEKNGVGLKISKTSFEFSWEGRVWGEWVLFTGRLEPFESTKIHYGGSVIREVDEVRVNVEGKDDNANKLEKIETFAVVWD